MFKEHSTEKLIEYIQSLPAIEQKFIVKTLSSPRAKKKMNPASTAELRVLNSIKGSLEEIKEAKRTGKKLPELQDLIDELKNAG